jgi:branched-chain amino acid transport system ATP-binding protein
MSDPSFLDVRHVSKRFDGLLANDDISITVARGELLGLIGPNGAGKSTLFNMIAGALPVTAGEIRLDGSDITSMAGTARCVQGIARTFQVPRSFDTMTVLENVMVGSFVRTASASMAKASAIETLEFVGIAERANAPAVDLTPPEKRRLEMARALATQPKLLLLDEVMTGLTPVEAKAGGDLVRQVRDRGITVIMVEHVMEVVMPLVDRAVVLHLGKVLAEGKPKDVVRDERVIKAYLGDRHRAA